MMYDVCMYIYIYICIGCVLARRSRPSGRCRLATAHTYIYNNRVCVGSPQSAFGPLSACRRPYISYIYGGCAEGLCRRVSPFGVVPDGHPTVSVRAAIPEGLCRRVSPFGVVPDGLPNGRAEGACAEGACAEGVFPRRSPQRSPRRSPSLYIIAYVQCLCRKSPFFLPPGGTKPWPLSKF